MLAIIAILVILDESHGIVALSDDLVVFLKAQKASNLVDVDSDVVQGCGLSSDAKALVVEFHGIWEFLLLQEVVSFTSVLVKLHSVESLLHPLHRGSHNWVLWV